MSDLRILISNPTRLHAHHHAYALQSDGMLLAMLTSFWHKPNSWVANAIRHLPQKFRRSANSFYHKRSHAKLLPTKVVEFRLAETLRLMFHVASLGHLRDTLLLAQKICYDWQVSRYIGRQNANTFVGFEISCARSFAQAKKRGMLTILDFAGVEHGFGLQCLQNLSVAPNAVSQKLSKIKSIELELADHVICVSDFAKNSLVKIGIPPTKSLLFNLV